MCVFGRGEGIPSALEYCSTTAIPLMEAKGKCWQHLVTHMGDPGIYRVIIHLSIDSSVFALKPIKCTDLVKT